MHDFSLEPDLRAGVLPISTAAGSLGRLVARATAERRPVVITQKGAPTGVLISVELFVRLKALAEAAPR